MKIAFVTECDYSAISPEHGADLVLFPFFTEKPVSYFKEIKGETVFFRMITNLSKTLKAMVIAGVNTDSYGKVRHSATVCFNGKMLAVCDMNSVKNCYDYTAGATYNVFSNGTSKVGVIVGDDLYSTECVKTLALSGADVLVNISDPVTSTLKATFARARAYEFGIPVAVCAHKHSLVASIDGKISYSSPAKISTVIIPPSYNYRLITLRRRSGKPE